MDIRRSTPHRVRRLQYERMIQGTASKNNAWDEYERVQDVRNAY